jgi:hypothetical protein
MVLHVTHNSSYPVDLDYLTLEAKTVAVWQAIVEC